MKNDRNLGRRRSRRVEDTVDMGNSGGGQVRVLAGVLNGHQFSFVNSNTTTDNDLWVLL